MTKQLKEIAHFIHGELTGDGDIEIKGIAGIKEAKKGDITFILSVEHAGLIDITDASCVIVPKTLEKSSSKPLIRVPNPSLAFSKLIEQLMPERFSHHTGIHPAAVVSKKARIGEGVALGAYVVIEEGAVIGDHTVIYPFSYIGRHASVGKDCLFYANVTVREEVVIGNRVTIHPGSVIGSDGFGYDTKPDGTHVKIPQLGTVIIEDDVELGSCVTVDRARFSKTVIGKGTKIDNLVQVAHNVLIGPNCIIAAQSGISGSTELGRNVILGGQVGIADHLKIGDFAKAGAQSGITKSFPANTVVFGYPARPLNKARELVGCIGLLPKLYERMKALEAKVKKLEEKK